MEKKHGDREEVKHADPVNDSPNARVRPEKQRVAALKKTMHEKNQRNPHRCRARVAVWIVIVLLETLHGTGIRHPKQTKKKGQTEVWRAFRVSRGEGRRGKQQHYRNWISSTEERIVQ